MVRVRKKGNSIYSCLGVARIDSKHIAAPNVQCYMVKMITD
jgi:hypothetical protein